MFHTQFSCEELRIVPAKIVKHHGDMVGYLVQPNTKLCNDSNL